MSASQGYADPPQQLLHGSPNSRMSRMLTGVWLDGASCALRDPTRPHPSGQVTAAPISSTVRAWMPTSTSKPSSRCSTGLRRCRRRAAGRRCGYRPLPVACAGSRLAAGLPLPASRCRARKWANGEFSPSLPSRPLCWACGPIAARRYQRAIRTAITSLERSQALGCADICAPLGCESVRDFRNCSGRSSHSRESPRCHCQNALFRNSANPATSSFAIAEGRPTLRPRSTSSRSALRAGQAASPFRRRPTKEDRLILGVAGRPVAPSATARQINARRTPDARARLSRQTR